MEKTYLLRPLTSSNIGTTSEVHTFLLPNKDDGYFQGEPTILAVGYQEFGKTHFTFELGNETYGRMNWNGAISIDEAIEHAYGEDGDQAWKKDTCKIYLDLPEKSLLRQRYKYCYDEKFGTPNKDHHLANFTHLEANAQREKIARDFEMKELLAK